jgi:hypothetical protein
MSKRKKTQRFNDTKQAIPFTRRLRAAALSVAPRRRGKCQQTIPCNLSLE